MPLRNSMAWTSTADPLRSMRLALSCAVTVESAEAPILGAAGITASMGADETDGRQRVFIS